MANQYPPVLSAADAEQTPLSSERRNFLKLTAMGGAALSLTSLTRLALGQTALDKEQQEEGLRLTRILEEATIADLQAAMSAGALNARTLVRLYQLRIRLIDDLLGLRSLIQVNPDAFAIARDLDLERQNSGPRGPLHGIPVVLKDNIDTADQMMTTAGSLALVGSPALQDATVAERLRQAGAIILGKANLSEWANFRGFSSSSGWSAVGGQCGNPYVIDRNPCGSSAGSAAAVSANLCAAALGTETDGSVVCPSSTCGVVGIKPTVGLTSRAGVVPISATQDTVGVHGRTVADAAAVLGPLTGIDPRDPATAASSGNSFPDYSQFVDSAGLQGARIGVIRQFSGTTEETDEVFEQAIQALRDGGATVIDPVAIPSFDEFNNDSSEIIVLVFEFKRDLNAYLATRSGVPVSNLAETIAFNQANADAELKFFGQQWMELAQDEIFSEAEYLQALERGPRLAGAEGIDAALAAHNLDALVAPTNSPAWPSDLITGDSFQFGTSAFAAVAGYPLVTVPAGDAFGLPLGLTFMASAWSEPTLIRLAAGFEAVNPARRRPGFLRTFDSSDSHAAQQRVQQSADRLKEALLRRSGGLPQRPRLL
ncbi:MAG: amidase [Wenzhouxiangellaceae bacterium]